MQRHYVDPLGIMLSAPQHLWRQRDLIVQLIQRDVGQRYRGSFLGILWSFINPLILLGVYTVVFSLIFQSRWQSDRETSTAEFAIIMFAGMAAFSFFSEVTNRAPMLILSVPNYVKKVVFPLEIMPLVAIGSALVNSLITCSLVMIGNFLVGGRISATVVFLPLAYLPLILITLGLAWVLSSLGVYIRDVGQAITLVVQMLFFLSPVFWSPAAAPDVLKNVLWINPLTIVLESFRNVLVFGALMDWIAWGFWVVCGSILCMLGYMWFMRTKSGFADVI